jgi:hypothetical protein
VIWRVIPAFLALLSAQPGTPAAAILGNWTLNAAKSRYGGGAEQRKSETMVCGMDSDTHCSVISERANGKTVRMRFGGVTNGSPGWVTGADDLDQVILKHVDSNTLDATFLFKGKPAFAYRAVRSVDKKTLTITAVDTKTRAPLKSVVVYDATRGVTPRGR